MLHQHPEIILGLLRSAFGIEHDRDVEVIASAENVAALIPVEYRADAVLVLQGSDRRPRGALVVEVQLQPDVKKRLTWPVYLTGVRVRLDCPVELIVIALDLATATWCRAPIDLDTNGSVVRPRVIGPASVPIVDTETALRHPELAMLSFLAHRDEPIALDVGRAILAACDDLDQARGELYADFVFSFINNAARTALEAEMQIENYQVKSEFLRQLKARAIAEGRAEGRTEGHAEGLVEGLSAAVIRIVTSRRLELSDTQRTVLAECCDVATLERWVGLAVTCASVDEILRG